MQTASPSVPLTFPPTFAFGVATAAHQVEGDNSNSDWWDFEQEPGRIDDQTRSGRACEHYSRFREDLQLVKDLNCTVYRFSIEWAKVEPEKGRFDQDVLAHYREVITTCRSMGLEPLVTLYHFTLPRWFANKGGWLNPESFADFQSYVTKVVDVLGDQVRWWVTINEPMVYLYQSYLIGKWPPAQKSFPNMVKAGRHLLRAHIEAYKILHAKPGFEGQPAQVGIAKHMRVFDAHREGDRWDGWATRRQEEAFNWVFMDSLEKGRYLFPLGIGESIPGAVPCHDFVGVNYYSRDRVMFSVKAAAAMFGVNLKTEGALQNDLGWELYPDGMLRVLRDIHKRYHKPIWITENGLADAADTRRASFVVQHLARVAQATQEGIPVLGYCHWSLYDNFEWAEGFKPRFGLFAVDYDTQARTLRPGGKVYARIAQEHAITQEILSQAGMTRLEG